MRGEKGTIAHSKASVYTCTYTVLTVLHRVRRSIPVDR